MREICHYMIVNLTLHTFIVSRVSSFGTNLPTSCAPGVYFTSDVVPLPIFSRIAQFFWHYPPVSTISTPRHVLVFFWFLTSFVVTLVYAAVQSEVLLPLVLLPVCPFPGRPRCLGDSHQFMSRGTCSSQRDNSNSKMLKNTLGNLRVGNWFLRNTLKRLTLLPNT